MWSGCAGNPTPRRWGGRRRASIPGAFWWATSRGSLGARHRLRGVGLAEPAGVSGAELGGGGDGSLDAVEDAAAHGAKKGLRWFVLEGGFLTYRAFIRRPASAEASFQLFGAEDFRRDAYDREIPHHYVPFDVLQRFDLPQLLEAAGTRGLIVNPIDGDWRLVDAAEARRWAPAGVELVCRAGPAEVRKKFREVVAQGL